MADLLLELFCEEIPARMQEAAAVELASRLSATLTQENLPAAVHASYVTPRRLAIILKNLPVQQADATIEKKGPKTSAPQQAIEGFLKSSGLTLDVLEKRMVGKDETYFAVIHKKGQPTATLLKEIIEKILNEFPWPKSMRWGSRDISWVRPLHSILCLFDGKVVPVEFAGIKAGNITRGHRFLAPAEIAISNVDEYVSKLKAAKVIANRDERKTEILKQAEAVASKAGLALKRDDGLLSEVTGLVEWPTVLMGTIDAKYMDLPPEVLVSEMRAHQKYFALSDKNGAMSDKFLITANMITEDGGKAVIAGNERVLRARLADGRFFWDQDRKKPLSEWAKGLAGVIFHAKIGTIAEKVERVKKLAVSLAGHVQGADKKLVEKAASLCKADLMTGMVGEFPELQGVMGRYYATAQKEDIAVADAIRDHYLPLGPDSPVPTKPVSICVALADKLDTLISMFAAGEKPTGSKDPFALRRSALGIIRIIRENNIRLDFTKIIPNHAETVIKYLNSKLQTAIESPVIGISSAEFIALEIIGFFSDRLIVQLKDEGTKHDIIKAVFARGEGDLVRVVARAKALQAFLETDDGFNLLAAYKRAINILNIEEKRDNKTYDGIIKGDAEIRSIEAPLNEVIGVVFSLVNEERFSEAMNKLASLRKSVDEFFDTTLINDPNPERREINLIILALIRAQFNRIADFGMIESETKERKAA